MSGALPCALSPTNDYTCVHPVMDSRVYAVGAWTRESPSSRVPSFIWPAGDYIRFSTLVSCEVSLASGLWKEATPEVVEKDCGSTVHLREDVCTTDSVFEHSSSVSTVCQSIARDLMASFGADAEQMRCKVRVYSRLLPFLVLKLMFLTGMCILFEYCSINVPVGVILSW